MRLACRAVCKETDIIPDSPIVDESTRKRQRDKAEPVTRRSFLQVKDSSGRMVGEGPKGRWHTSTVCVRYA